MRSGLRTCGAALAFGLLVGVPWAGAETRTFAWKGITNLEVRGGVTLDLAPGPEFSMEVTASRELWDQLEIGRWGASATVAVGSGLWGPREPGTVLVKVVMPRLGTLGVGEGSGARVRWPGAQGRLRVGPGAWVEVEGAWDRFSVSARWRSKVSVGGSAGFLEVSGRQEAQIDARGLKAAGASAHLDEASVLWPPPGVRGSGTWRRGSRVETDPGAPWSPKGS